MSWLFEKRCHIGSKIDAEAKRAAGNLGASDVLIVAFFKDCGYVHMLDGGTAPQPRDKIYKQLVDTTELRQRTSGRDAEVSYSTGNILRVVNN
jgi:hypothetical protein